MKSAKMLTILVLALGLMVCVPSVSEAAPMGTAFTYQGRLIDANSAADGLYDFQFKLYDDPRDPCDANQVGGDVKVADVDVNDGYFTVELDFNSPGAFDGDARWLEIGVRPGELEEPNEYTTLSPRQEVTSTPYAIYADKTRGIFVDESGNVGIGTTRPESKLHLVSGDILLENNSEIQYKDTGDIVRTLLVWDEDDFVKIVNNANDDGGAIKFHTKTGGRESVRITSDGKLGIGTTDPNKELEVVGNAHFEGDVTWQSKTGYISVSAAAFRPYLDGYDFQNLGSSLLNVDSVSDIYYAPVQLPHGATVTEFTFYWRDSSGSNGTAILYRSTLDAGASLMALVWTSGSSATPSSSSTNTINYATIDNSQYAYYLEWYLTDTNVKGYGVIIKYTFTESY